jgi:casein kinase 1
LDYLNSKLTYLCNIFDATDAGKKWAKILKLSGKLTKERLGQIYQAINTRTNLEVAVKIEPVNTDHPQLIYECKLYNYLHNDSTVIDKGIPNIYYCSTEGKQNSMKVITTCWSWI